MNTPELASQRAANRGDVLPAANRRELLRLLRFSAMAGVVMITLAIFLLAARRLGGAFQQPLTDVGFLSAGIVAASFALLLRMLARHCGWSRTVVMVLPTCLALAFAGVISSPGASTSGLLMLWSVVLLEELVSWGGLLRAEHAIPDSVAEPEPRDESDRQLPTIEELSVDQLPAGVTQQLTRSIEEDGCETLMAMVRVMFEPGERTKNEHLAFCPPFQGSPTLYLEQVEGESASVRATQVEAFGARLELRLAKACQSPSDAVVQIVATYEPA